MNIKELRDKLADFAAGGAFIGLLLGGEYIAEKIAELSGAAVFVGLAAVLAGLAFVQTDC